MKYTKMAYTKTNWKDRAVERPRTYRMQQNPDGTVTLIPEPGTVYEPGTPVNAPNMNKIEQGIVDATTEAISWAKSFGLGDIALNISGQNLNDHTLTGFYCGSNVVGAPSDDWHYFISILHTHRNYCAQIAIPYHSGDMWYRKKSGGGTNENWSSWTPIWNGGNFDPSSKQDRLGYTPVNKAGDYMDGKLTLPLLDLINISDVYLTLDTSDIPINLYRKKTIILSKNVGNGEAWLFRSTRPSDGAFHDYTLSGNGGEIFHSGNTPRTRFNGDVYEVQVNGGWRPVGGIKRVQRGSATAGATGNIDIAITSVNTAKAFVNLNTIYNQFHSDHVGTKTISAALTSDTNLRIFVTSDGSSISVPIQWEVVESY